MIPRKSIPTTSMFRLLLLLLSIYLHQSSSLPRNLDSITDASNQCHDSILNASSVNILGDVYVTNLASTSGIVFSIENTALKLDGSGVDGREVTITALSVYLDGTEGTDYSVYLAEEDYIDGSLLGGVLGGEGEVDVSAGWTKVSQGTINVDSMNKDGMAIIHLDPAISLPPSSLKSVYIRCTGVSLIVGEWHDDGTSLEGEVKDEFATVDEEYDFLQIRVGRGVLPMNWVSGLPGSIFEKFYPPRRFIGNIYVMVDTCTITVRSSFFDFYGIGETNMQYRYRMVTPRLSHHDIKSSHGHNNPFYRMLQDNSNTIDSTTGCFETDEIYPVLDGEFKKFAIEKYNTNLPPSITVADVTYIFKADQELYSSKGPCKNIRFIFDEVLVYKFANPDEMTVAELTSWPFLNEADRQELLLNLIQFNSKFSQFGKIEGPIVTDPTLPTRMPTSTPSVTPTVSFNPTVGPSDIVSDAPSVFPSTYPSTTPSAIPSEFSSEHPSTFPSQALAATDLSSPPTEPIFVGTITTSISVFQYDIWYSPSRFSDDVIKDFIIGNVTKAFRETLFLEQPLLSIVTNHGLKLSSDPKEIPSVKEDINATDIECHTDNLPENSNNVCKRFTLRLSFDHMSTISADDVRFWVLRVSEQSAGKLQSSYAGHVSVKSDQVISFEETSAAPTPEEEKIFCDVISEALNMTLSSNNYTVTGIECTDFEFIPYASSRQRLRLFQVDRGGWKRRLQSVDGELNIYYNISAEYPIRLSGEGDFMEGNFDNLIEDSINSDGLGEEMKKSLEERDVEIVENAIVEAKTAETPAPTSSPTYDQEERAPPNVGTIETISSSPPNASVIVGVVFAIIVLCCTLAMYMYYLFYLHTAKNRPEYDSYGEYEFEPSLLIQDEHINHIEWDPIKRNSITISNFSDEPDSIPDMKKDFCKPFEITTDDANTTSSTISDLQTGVGEGMIINESMIRFNAFDNRVQHQNHGLPADFEEQVRQKIKSKEKRIELNARENDFDNSLNSHDSFEARLRSKLVEDLHHSHVESRIRSKLGRENPKSSYADRDTVDMRVQRKLGSYSEIPLNIKDGSVDSSFEKRLRKNLSHDGENASSNVLGQSMTSVDSLNERIQQKIPRDSLVASTSSLEDFDARIQRKIEESSVQGGSTSSKGRSISSKHNPLKDAQDMQERIRLKLSEGNGGKSSSANAAPSSSMQERIRQKLAHGTQLSPLARSDVARPGIQNMPSNSTMQDKIMRKLSQNGVDSLSAAERPVVEKLSSINHMEHRIQEKLARDSSPSHSADVQRSVVQKTSSMYVMEQRIREKLSQDSGQTPPSSIDVPRPGFQQTSSVRLMEQRIQEKLTGENNKPFTSRNEQRPRVEKMTSTNNVMQRVQEKLARDSSNTSLSSSFNADKTGAQQALSTGTRDVGRPGVQKMSSSSMTQRTQAKMAQNDAQFAAATSADGQEPGAQNMSSWSCIEQHITKGRPMAEAHALSSDSSNTFERVDSMDLLESNTLSRKQSTTSRDSFELKLISKLHQSALHLSHGAPEDILAGSRLESKPPKQSRPFTFDPNLQRKAGPSENETLKSQTDSAISFTTKLQRKRAESARGNHHVPVSTLDKSTMSTATMSTVSVGATVSTKSDESSTVNIDEKIKKIATDRRPAKRHREKSDEAKSQQYE